MTTTKFSAPDGISNFVIEALDNYWIHGFEPGSFVTSLLCNEPVFDVLVRADPWNKRNLGPILDYIIINGPEGSFGSKKHVHDWLNKGAAFQQHQKRRVVDILSTP